MLVRYIKISIEISQIEEKFVAFPVFKWPNYCIFTFNWIYFECKTFYKATCYSLLNGN